MQGHEPIGLDLPGLQQALEDAGEGREQQRHHGIGTMARWALREFLNTLEMPMGWGGAKTLGSKTSANATGKRGEGDGQSPFRFFCN